jgi:predicted Zn-dependent protease
MKVEGAAWRLSSALAMTFVVCHAQTSSQRTPIPGSEHAAQPGVSSQSSASSQSETTHARDELQRGTALTRQGQFAEAIPHLIAAQPFLQNDFAVEFNLSLCYVGLHEYKKAIQILDGLRTQGHDDANVENLLAQAYIGNDQQSEAIAALERASAISPKNEKLFAFVADACMDHQDFDLGLRVIDMGLAAMPDSAKLHYARATFLSELDQLDRAKVEFALADKFGQGTEIGYLAASQQNLLVGNIDDAVRIAREGVKQGIQSAALFTILGKALLRSGVLPGQPEFDEAQHALERSVLERPNDASAQIALGQAYLLGGQVQDAILHLEVARQIRPNQPSVYANLAKAYRRMGDSQRAQEALQTLETLNQAQAEHIRSAPGERKMSYGGSASSPQ